MPGFKHGVGHIQNIMRYGAAASKGQVRFLYHYMLQEAYGDRIPPVVRIQLFHEPFLLISDPKVARDIYTTKNNIIDKAPRTGLIFQELHDGIGNAPSDQAWKHNRNVLGQAFFKDKLKMMLQIVMYQMEKKVARMNEKMKESPDGSIRVDLPLEVQDMFNGKMIHLLFGEDIAHVELTLSVNGE